MALRRPGYSDWSIGYMPEGQWGKKAECISSARLFSFGKLWLYFTVLVKHVCLCVCVKQLLLIRAVLTSKDHGFSRFKPWKSLHRLLLEVQCVTNLGLLHILHPCYYVAHLACEAAQQPDSDSQTSTM